MRNIRARRRITALLILLLAVSVIALIESRIEAFAPELKSVAEKKIEEAFKGDIDVSIGRLEGGILRSFMLRDVLVLKKGAKHSPSIIAIDTIVSNYRIWNFIFPGLAVSRPYIAAEFSTRNKILSGFLSLSGTAEDASVNGYVRLFGSDDIELSGSIKNGAASLVLRPKDGYVKVEGNFAADGILLLKILASHIKLYGFDVTGEATVKNIASDGLEGEIEAKNIILNYKPFNDVRGSYRVARDIFEVKDMDLGRICLINGRFGLHEPHVIDAVVVTDNVSLDQTLAIFNPRYASMVSGTMNSKWELKGPAKKIASRIKLDIKRGRILEMKFESLSADFKGDGPVITIEDSRITRESGSFALAGYMDLTRIGKDSLFENLRISSGESAVLWDGYETAKWQDVREFRMKKKVVEGIDVGFKKFVTDEKVDESVRDRDEYELSYKLHPNDSFKVKYSDGSNFFGLEHKDKF
jgi:hypothetical protein